MSNYRYPECGRLPEHKLMLLRSLVTAGDDNAKPIYPATTPYRMLPRVKRAKLQ